MDAHNLAAGIIVLDTGLPDWSARRIFDAARSLGLTEDAAAIVVGELVAEVYNEGRDLKVDSPLDGGSGAVPAFGRVALCHAAVCKIDRPNIRNVSGSHAGSTTASPPEPCVSLHGNRAFREAGRRRMTHWMTTDKFRVAVEQFNDGWGWHAWEALTDEGWRPLFSPTMDNARRRFRAHERAGEFFLVLAEIIAGNGSELVPTRLRPPGAVAPTPPSRR
ncbi:MAG TPA: hypothetical protein VMW56_30410 [Candidatus Margulisiibacteriota bacterium]|nr:hypothetical protein [Candidatus Margulisiibacteriota bacterium]